MCDAFLEAAEKSYTDLLPTVRTEVAKAMSGWLQLYGYRAQVWWNDEDLCFSGRLINVPGGACVEFRATRPTEVQEAFEKATRNFMGRGAARRKAEAARSQEQDRPLAAE